MKCYIGFYFENNWIFPKFIKHDTLSMAYLNQSINFVPFVRDNFEKIKASRSEYRTWLSSRIQVINNRNREPDIQEAYQGISISWYQTRIKLVRIKNWSSRYLSVDGSLMIIIMILFGLLKALLCECWLQYFVATFQYQEYLRHVLSSLREKISSIIGREVSSANEQQGLGFLILILVLLISPAIIGLVRHRPTTAQPKKSLDRLYLPTSSTATAHGSRKVSTGRCQVFIENCLHSA